MGGKAGPLDRVRSAVWGMLYADAGVVSKPGKGVAKMMTVIHCERLPSIGSHGVGEED